MVVYRQWRADNSFEEAEPMRIDKTPAVRRKPEALVIRVNSRKPQLERMLQNRIVGVTYLMSA